MSWAFLAVGGDSHLLTFEHHSEYNGGSKWPYDHTIAAVHPEHGEVGSLKYKTSSDRSNAKIKVDKLEVALDHRRKGYGSALMNQMQTQHPKSSIDYGERTDLGAARWSGYGEGKADKRGRTAAYEGLSFHERAAEGLSTMRVLEAHHPEHGHVGTIWWQGDDHSISMGKDKPRKVLFPKGEIRDIKVPDQHQRNGVATALWNQAKELTPELHHSTNPSDSGRAWAEHTAAGDGWKFEHRQIEGPHWRSFGDKPGGGSVMSEYKLQDDGVQFDTGSMHEHQLRKHGPEAVERLQDAIRAHHGVEDAPPPAAAPPARRAPRIYYHGTTTADVTHILPAARHGAGVTFPSDTSHEHAYASLSKSTAWHYAEMAHHVTAGKPRVYQVRPLHGDHSHVEEDPQWENGRLRGNYQGDRRSKVGFEVVRELKTPRHIHDSFDWPEKDEENGIQSQGAWVVATSGPLYHGTAAENLTHILPAQKSGARPIYGETDSSYAYATHSPEDAWDYAKDAHAEAYHQNPRTTQIPRVYEVHPLGDDHSHVEADPNYIGDQRRDTNPGDRRSRAGFRVVRELPSPPDLHEHLDWLRGGIR